MGIGCCPGMAACPTRAVSGVRGPAYNVCVIVDNAVYVDGRRTESCALEDTYETSRDRGGFAWIGLYEPSREEFDSVAGEFGVHEMAVEDALKAHSRPKVERYGDSLFVVLKRLDTWKTQTR